MKCFLLAVIFLSTAAHASRPSWAVTFVPDLCVCQDGVSIQPLNCSSFCVDKKTNGAEVLFANLKVTAEISLGPLRNTYGWCNYQLPSDLANPMCILEAKSKDGSISYTDVFSVSNSLTSNISTLDYDEVYTLTLIETASGARSKTIKFVKFSNVE